MTTQTITYRFSLDIFKNGVQRILQGFQTGEAVARKMEITLVAGADSFDLPMSNISALMYVKRPSQTEPSINACEIDYINNKIKYDIPTIDEQEAGIVQMQLKLIDTTGEEDKVIVSPKFGFEVWESDISDSEAETTPQYTALTLAIASAEKVAHSAITEFVIDDDNLLVVTFADGSQYTSTVIQDALATISNVEKYVERAEAAMVSAEGSASVALGAKDTAVSSSATAVTAANSALLAEQNAKTSELNASDSEANALAYKTSANTSESNAKTSEQNAKASENNAKTSETNAKASETNAKVSEDNAKASEINARNDALSASDNAKLSQSYSVGGTNTRPNEDNDNAKHYKEVCEQVAASLQGGFIPMGTVAFANLPTNASPGWMYNVSDEFTSDSRFKDGGGKKYAEGTNVYLTSDSMWDCLSGAIPTVNGKNGNSITLDSRDIAMTGYTKGTSESAIVPTDTISQAIGKLEKHIDAKISTSRITDNLETETSGYVLSAKQGKVLDEKISTKYTKPSTGIPSTDLTSAVQTSLGKADSALQPSVLNYADYTISTTWVANTDIGNYEDYPFKQKISTTVYTDNRDCLVLGANASAMPTKEEMDEMGKLSQFVDFTNGVTVFASEETTVSLTLRVKGV